MTHDVEIDIEFLRTEDGGRATPVSNDYRPQLYYDGHDWDARHEYPDVASVVPGQRTRAYLSLISPAEHLGKLIPGKAVSFREGRKVVATGVVTRVLNLPQSAYRARLENALDAYYRHLGVLADRLADANDRTVCRACVEATFHVRSSVHSGEVNAIHQYLSAERKRRTEMTPANDDPFPLLEEVVATAPQAVT
jgi:elongation factor Tu